MDVKKRLLFLTPITIVLILFGVYYILADLSSASVTTIGDGVGNSTLLGKDSEIFNITVTASAGWDITEINVTFFIDGANAFTFANGNFFNPVTLDPETGDPELLSEQADSEANRTNVTLYGDGSAGTWYCYNNSLTTTASVLCANGTGAALSSGANSSLIISLNLSVAQDIEGEASIVVNVSNDTAIGLGQVNVTNIYVDHWAPRLLELNISDGNTTLTNGSDTKGDNFLLRGSDIKIEATIVDAIAIETVRVFYETNDSEVPNPENSTFVDMDLVTGSSTNGVARYEAIFKAANFTQAGNENISRFTLQINDTSGNLIGFNDTVVGGDNIELAFNFTLNQTLPEPQGINVTDATNTLANDANNGLYGGDDYLAAVANAEFTLEVTGVSVNTTDVLMFYTNDTLILGTYTAGAELNATVTSTGVLQYLLMTNITFGEDTAGNDTVMLFNRTLDLSNNDSANFSFAFVIPHMGNKTGENYTTIVGPYNFVVDGSAPSNIVVTAPTDTSIEVQKSISYSCSASDAGSGVKTYTWTLTKPGGNTVTKTGSSASFTDTNTNEAGEYSLVCNVKDNVGNSADSSSAKFTALYSTQVGGGAAVGAGSSGGGSRTVTVPADTEVDAGEVTSEGVNTLISAGGTATFTVSGQSHSAKILEVKDDEVTIEIRSHEPLTLTLKVGEMKELDIDHDEINDLSVKLNAIVDGQADITFAEITAEGLAPSVPGEGVPPSKAAEEAGGASRAGLIITIVVIVVVLAIGYFLIRKRK